MNALPPWKNPDWVRSAEATIGDALRRAGRPPTGPIALVKSWGRSCLHTVPTDAGVVWVKHGYRLPPGEELVLDALAARWPGHVPDMVATWPGAVAMNALPGRELPEDGALEDWVAAARTLGEIAQGEAQHADDWLARGVRDRGAAAWPEAVASLVAGEVVQSLDPELRGRFEALAPAFVERFITAFRAPPTLVHQDSGCCNIHVVDEEPGASDSRVSAKVESRSADSSRCRAIAAPRQIVVFDWSDVVVGHPVFSCDRLLDQVPPAFHVAVIDAFRAPLAMSAEEFQAMRRSNVLHEVIRYHDELAFLSPEDPVHEALASSIRSQIRVLVEHETGQRLRTTNRKEA